jgi:ketosteroid isomerase-like protein
MDDPEPIKEADESFFEALETLDVEAIMECWAFDEPVSLLFPGVDMAVGRKLVEAQWEIVVKYTRELKAMMKPVSTLRKGDLAFSFLTGTIVTTHGDETLSVEVYVTNVYRLEEREWKLVHHHMTPAPHQPSFFEQRLN